jgi:uncharacterized protein (TIGR03437 family)
MARLILLGAPSAFGQVVVSGVVSAASWASPVAAGSVVAIFGSQLANITASASGYPLPTNIRGTSVTVNGVAAPLYFVSPGQINAQMPSSIYSPVTGAISASLIVTSPIGTSPATQVAVTDSVPGVFTADATGCGQAAVLNVTPAGTVSLNSLLAHHETFTLYRGLRGIRCVQERRASQGG